MKKYQIMAECIAGALAKKDLQRLVGALTKMGSDDDGNCDFVADTLRNGYYNWTGENLEQITMKKSQAQAKARKYSRQYMTFWYVREVSPGQFAPWAHHSDDERTVATFYCGDEWKWSSRNLKSNMLRNAQAEVETKVEGE